jgi:hypothetical protein
MNFVLGCCKYSCCWSGRVGWVVGCVLFVLLFDCLIDSPRVVGREININMNPSYLKN